MNWYARFTPVECLSIFLVVALCSGLSSWATYSAVNGIYSQVLISNREDRKNDEVSKLLIHRKLNECAVEFGTYVATKGKNGQHFFEH